MSAPAPALLHGAGSVSFLETFLFRDDDFFQLPFARVDTHHLRSWTMTFSETPALTSLARQEGATMFIALLAALDVLLLRWSGQEDVVVGTPIAGRTRTSAHTAHQRRRSRAASG